MPGKGAYLLAVVLAGAAGGCAKSELSPVELRSETSYFVRHFDPRASIKLSGTVVPHADVVAMPRFALATGDYRILLNIEGDTLVHVFDRTGNSHLGSFGPSGHGPGEYESAWDYTARGDTLWIFDMPAQRVSTIDVRRMLESAEPDSSGVIATTQLQTAGNTLENAQHVAVLASGNLAATGAFADGRVHVFSREGRLFGRSGLYLHENSTLPPYVVWHSYSSDIVAEPDGNRVALAAKYRDQLDIIDLSDSSQVSLRSLGFEPTYVTRNGRYVRTGESKMGYVSLAASRDHVFALFSGHAPRELENESLAFYGRHIRVFTWEGEFIADLDVPDYLFSISADVETNDLTAVQHYPGVAVRTYGSGQVLRSAATR